MRLPWCCWRLSAYLVWRARWPASRSGGGPPRCGWSLLLAFTVAFNLFASYKSNADGHQNFGLALLETGRVDEAITQFQKERATQAGLRDGPEQSRLRSSAKGGRVDEAITQLQQALQVNPDDAQARFNLGNALAQKGTVDEAITQYQQALQIYPGYVEAHYNLGVVLLQKGRADEAITQYQQALQINPGYRDAHINLGYALLQKGTVEEAMAHFQKALQLNPADPSTQNKLAWLLATVPQASLRNGAKALELARQASLLTGGENPAVLQTLAAACAEAGRFSEAVETAQHALRLAEAQSNTALTAALQSELKLYQAGSPYHSPEPPH